jgi:hypothetical protein
MALNAFISNLLVHYSARDRRLLICYENEKTYFVMAYATSYAILDANLDRLIINCIAYNLQARDKVYADVIGSPFAAHIQNKTACIATDVEEILILYGFKLTTDVYRMLTLVDVLVDTPPLHVNLTTIINTTDPHGSITYNVHYHDKKYTLATSSADIILPDTHHVLIAQLLHSVYGIKMNSAAQLHHPSIAEN